MAVDVKNATNESNKIFVFVSNLSKSSPSSSKTRIREMGCAHLEYTTVSESRTLPSQRLELKSTCAYLIPSLLLCCFPHLSYGSFTYTSPHYFPSARRLHVLTLASSGVSQMYETKQEARSSQKSACTEQKSIKGCRWSWRCCVT